MLTWELGQIRAIFKGGDDGETTLLLLQSYVCEDRARRLLPHKALAWHLMTREGQPLTVVDVVTELCDTAFCYPVLQAFTKLPLPREGTEEIFWLARDRYFPVHRYPPKVRDDGREREEEEDSDSDSE